MGRSHSFASFLYKICAQSYFNACEIPQKLLMIWSAHGHFSFYFIFVLKFSNAQNQSCSLQNIKYKNKYTKIVLALPQAQKNCSVPVCSLHVLLFCYFIALVNIIQQGLWLVGCRWNKQGSLIKIPSWCLKGELSACDVMQHAEHGCSAEQFPSVFKTLAAAAYLYWFFGREAYIIYTMSHGVPPEMIFKLCWMYKHTLSSFELFADYAQEW
jgi:hypothetical protein